MRCQWLRADLFAVFCDLIYQGIRPQQEQCRKAFETLAGQSDSLTRKSPPLPTGDHVLGRRPQTRCPADRPSPVCTTKLITCMPAALRVFLNSCDRDSSSCDPYLCPRRSHLLHLDRWSSEQDPIDQGRNVRAITLEAQKD